MLDQHKFICGGFSFKHKHATLGQVQFTRERRKAKKRSMKGEEVNYLDLSVVHYVEHRENKTCFSRLHDTASFVYIRSIFSNTDTMVSEILLYQPTGFLVC